MKPRTENTTKPQKIEVKARINKTDSRNVQGSIFRFKVKKNCKKILYKWLGLCAKNEKEKQVKVEKITK